MTEKGLVAEERKERESEYAVLKMKFDEECDLNDARITEVVETEITQILSAPSPGDKVFETIL